MKHIQQLADVYGRRVWESERAVLRGGFRDGEAMVNAAVDAGLTGRHFQRPEHPAMFAYLGLCHEHGIEPTIFGAIRVLRGAGIPLSLDDLDAVLWQEEGDATDTVAALPDACAAVVANAADLYRARRCLTEAINIMSGLMAGAFDILIRPRAAA